MSEDEESQMSSNMSDEESPMSSYFLKTAMFTLLEETPPIEWQHEDWKTLLDIVKKLFISLQDAFKRQFLGSFFTEEINLLEGIPKEVLKKASIEADVIVESINEHSSLEFVLPTNVNASYEKIKKTCYIADNFLAIANWLKRSEDLFLKLDVERLIQILGLQSLPVETSIVASTEKPCDIDLD